MAHPELDQLADFCFQFAKNQLKKRGEFHPFAATRKAGGPISPLASFSGAERPSADALIHELAGIIRSLTESGEADAVAICYDGRVLASGTETKRDAIAVALEHRNGESLSLYLPYAKKLFGHRYDELIAAAKERRFFD